LTTLQVTLAVTKMEIDPMWILCNSNIFKNKAILTNVQKSNKPIRLKGIEGSEIVIDLGYGKVNAMVVETIENIF